MPVIALPLLSLFIDIKSAAMLLSMPLLFSNLPQALEGGKTGRCLMQLMPVFLGMIPASSLEFESYWQSTQSSQGLSMDEVVVRSAAWSQAVQVPFVLSSKGTIYGPTRCANQRTWPATGSASPIADRPRTASV